MKVAILFGPPGSGKGTTAEKILQRTGYAHLSTGDMLREAVKKGSPVGREAEGYMKRGELVPDGVILRVVEERLDAGRPDAEYLFDGFPRTVEQARLLAESLARRGGRIEKVVCLDAPREVLVSRLVGRRVCRQCGANYHVTNVPPKKPGVCDRCGGELYQRPDDQEATILNRLDVYARQTEALIAMYREQGVLARVNSDCRADDLADAVAAMLAGGRKTKSRTKPTGGGGR